MPPMTQAQARHCCFSAFSSRKQRALGQSIRRTHHESKQSPPASDTEQQTPFSARFTPRSKLQTLAAAAATTITYTQQGAVPASTTPVSQSDADAQKEIMHTSSPCKPPKPSNLNSRKSNKFTENTHRHTQPQTTMIRLHNNPKQRMQETSGNRTRRDSAQRSKRFAFSSSSNSLLLLLLLLLVNYLRFCCAIILRCPKLSLMLGFTMVTCSLHKVGPVGESG